MVGGEGQAAPISSDELRARLSHRRRVTVDGDRIVVRARTRAAVLCAVMALVACTFLVAMYAGGEASAEWRRDPFGTGAVHVAVPMFIGLGLFAALRPGLVGRSARPARGARLTIASTLYLPLSPDELAALVTRGARAMTPSRREHAWQEVREEVAGRDGVILTDDGLTVASGGGVRLRIDDAGVHARMPQQWRTVHWEELAEVSWVGSGRKLAAVLILQPGVPSGELRGRRGRLVARGGRPAALVPWSRDTPVDLATLAALLHAHPRSHLSRG